MEPQGQHRFADQVRSQYDALQRVLDSSSLRAQLHSAAEGLHRVHRIWLVGTGASLYAAELGAAMLGEAGRAAQAVSSMHFVEWAPVVGPHDGVLVISHSGTTAYALSARSQAFNAGLEVFMVTREGSGLPNAIEPIPKEPSETASVSYTTSVLAIAMLAGELGADAYGREDLSRVPGAVRNALDDAPPALESEPARLVVFTGAGPASVTARAAALMFREAARIPAEGFDVETLLHGNAVPLDARDALVALTTPDPGGMVEAVAHAATAAGLKTSILNEPAPLSPVLAQIPLTVRLELAASTMAAARGQDPDTVITGPWKDDALWRLGAPG
jgi:glucosamine--fructose-6-phosphate aminotransferase (isomerizing)